MSPRSLESGISTHPHMVWVVFSDTTDLPILKCLKRGFRHCYILLSDGQKWFSIDPMAHMTEVAAHTFNTAFNLPLWIESQGETVIAVEMTAAEKKPAPLMLLTCVEMVKRLLGIQSRWIFTPWQLYAHLLKNTQQPSLHQ